MGFCVRLSLILLLLINCLISRADDTIYNNLAAMKDDSAKVAALMNAALDYEYTDTSKARLYVKDAQKLAYRLGLKGSLAQAYTVEGYLYEDISDYKNALICYNKTIILYKELKDSTGLAKTYSNIGLAYNYMGYYTQAIEVLQKSLKLREETKDQKGISTCLMNIGLVNSNAGNNESAKDYYSRALSIKQEMGDTLGIAIALLNIGNVCLYQKDYKTALENFESSLKISESLGDLGLTAYNYLNTGEAWFRLKNTEKATGFFLKAQKILTELGDRYGLSMVYIALGEVHKTKKQYDVALDYGLKSILLSEEAGILNNLKEGYHLIASVYELLNKPDEALHYYKLYTTFKDSLAGTEKTKMLNELESKYQVENTRQQMIIQKEEIARKEAQMEQQAMYRNTLIAGIVIMLIFSFFIWRSYSHKKSANLLLESKNKEITKQKSQLEETNRMLEYLSIVASKTDNAVIIANPSGNIEWVNKAFTQLYGLKSEDITGSNQKSMLAMSTNPDIRRLFDSAIEKGQSVVYSSRTKLPGKDERWIQTTLTPVISQRGYITHVVAIDSDISLLKETEHRLEGVNHELLNKNKQITDSIVYAKVFQDALLPSPDYVREALPGFLCFYHPRDIVSGDYYWIHKKGSKVLFALIDCTGHGVPGAFMSIMGNTLLNEAVRHRGLESPREILTYMNKSLKEIFRLGSGSDNPYDDGMDATICLIDKEEHSFTIGLANHEALLVRNKEAQIIEGSYYSIGGEFSYNRESEYTEQKIDILAGDCLYLYSDGYADQFSSTGEEKLMKTRFRQVLVSLSMLSPADQEAELEKHFNQWKGNHPQVDDVTVTGLIFS